MNDRKRELRNQYLEMKSEGGVYQIRNLFNNKVFVAATPNLKSLNGKRAMLDSGTHMNKKLQEDWKQLGSEAFVFEVLEIMTEPEEPFFDKKAELKKMEQKWMEKLQPYQERGYH